MYKVRNPVSVEKSLPTYESNNVTRIQDYYLGFG